MRASRAFRSSAACVTLARGTVTGMSRVVPSSSIGMNDTPIFGKCHAHSASRVRVTSESACHPSPRVKITVSAVTTANVTRNITRQACSAAPHPDDRLQREQPGREDE